MTSCIYIFVFFFCIFIPCCANLLSKGKFIQAVTSSRLEVVLRTCSHSTIILYFQLNSKSWDFNNTSHLFSRQPLIFTKGLIIKKLPLWKFTSKEKKSFGILDVKILWQGDLAWKFSFFLNLESESEKVKVWQKRNIACEFIFTLNLESESAMIIIWQKSNIVWEFCFTLNLESESAMSKEQYCMVVQFQS